MQTTAILIALDAALARGSLGVVRSGSLTARLGLALARGPEFDADDKVHIATDVIRWAEWIRDYRRIKDFAAADSIAGTARLFGQVRLMDGGHVLVVAGQNLEWLQPAINDAAKALVTRAEAGGDVRN